MSNAISQTTMYRLDIDGLRALAVLSVIFFHLNANWLPGGFVGVDVFFVISGYLISSHIFRELATGTFSIVEFYRRRVKRIAPAMLTVTAVSLVTALLLLRPDDAIVVAKSAVWSIASLANVYFWSVHDSGYFAPNSEHQPLLHLWSLGVEEQFYLIWPILLMVVYRPAREKFMLFAMVAIAAASFAFGNLYFSTDPSFVYYMLPSRAGELLMGAIVALVEKRGGHRAFPASYVAPTALLGFFLLGASFFTLSESEVFPGLLAIPPTLGAALLLFAGTCKATLLSRALSAAPLVVIGRISYSAYLWHWPLLAFYRYGYGAVNLRAAIVIFVLTLVLAWATYRFVEQPTRKTRRNFIPLVTRQFVLPAGALVAIALIPIYGERVWPERPVSEYRRQLAQLRNQTQPASAFSYVCQRQRITSEDITDARCVVGAPNQGTARVVLWGDSNAAHYVGMLGTFASKGSFSFRNIQVGSCPPVIDEPTSFAEARRRPDCQHSASLIRPLLNDADVIVISSSWSVYQGMSERFLDAFFRMARRMAAEGKLVVIIGKLPVINAFDRLCAEKALSYPFLECKDNRVPVPEDVNTANERLRQFAQSTPNVRYFDATSYVCPNGRCSAYGPAGRVIYYDQSHLTMAGSWALGETIIASEGLPAAFRGLANWRAGLEHVTRLGDID